MQESMDGAQARKTARGNLFSFSLPWDEIEARCQEADANFQADASKRGAPMLLPHDEDVLACLTNVHIIGGAKDLIEHLEGATMRCAVVLSLIALLRQSGYPGYEGDVNSDVAVQERMQRLYGNRYGAKAFVPQRVRATMEEAYRAKLSGTSLITDKNATPSEPVASVAQLEASLRPLSLVPGRNAAGVSSVHETYGEVLCQYQTLEFTTKSAMVNQHHAAYLGMAYPYTLPVAVGGYDVRGQDRWRRAINPEWLDDMEACEVKLFDLTRGLPQRIEGQYRRHWGFLPGLWNLYFREQVNTWGQSLCSIARQHVESLQRRRAGCRYGGSRYLRQIARWLISYTGRKKTQDRRRRLEAALSYRSDSTAATFLKLFQFPHKSIARDTEHSEPNISYLLLGRSCVRPGYLYDNFAR